MLSNKPRPLHTPHAMFIRQCTVVSEPHAAGVPCISWETIERIQVHRSLHAHTLNLLACQMRICPARDYVKTTIPFYDSLFQRTSFITVWNTCVQYAQSSSELAHHTTDVSLAMYNVCVCIMHWRRFPHRDHWSNITCPTLNLKFNYWSASFERYLFLIAFRFYIKKYYSSKDAFVCNVCFPLWLPVPLLLTRWSNSQGVLCRT